MATSPLPTIINNVDVVKNVTSNPGFRRKISYSYEIRNDRVTDS